jgi:hypothetical protein
MLRFFIDENERTREAALPIARIVLSAIFLPPFRSEAFSFVISLNGHEVFLEA